MLPLNISAVVAGQLLSAAFAAGLNLYATVAVLGTAARLSLIPPLPPGLRGLSNALVIGSAAALFLAELILEKLPVIGAGWAVAHSVVRPLAAGLLTFLAFGGQPLEISLGLAAAVGCLAFAAHGAKLGLRVILASARRPRDALYTAAAALALDLLALAITLAALLNPDAAAVVGIGVALLLLLVGPLLWRAATFGGHAFRARLSGFFGHAGWKSRRQLPRYARRAIPAQDLGQGEPRATRAAVVGLPGAAAYRLGWLVFDPAGASFLSRSLLSTRRVPLPAVRSIDIRPAPVVDVLRVTTDARKFTIFLLRDGPSVNHTVAELTRLR